MSLETVLITGASSGIGLELARCFAAEGCRLALVARKGNALETLAAELRKACKIQAQVITTDLAHPDAPARLLAHLQAAGIKVDVLVNNAGFGAQGKFAELPLQRQLEMLQVNITSLTHLTRLLLPGMIERLGDHIACFHFRSVQRNPDGTFFEANHLEGCANLPAVMTVALKLNAKRDAAHKLSVRPDHGHRILDDLKKPVNANPGYDCLGRMKGLAELRGLQTGIAFTMGDKL